MNPLTQHRRGFKVERLPEAARQHYAEAFSTGDGQRHMDAYEEQLSHNTQTPVPEQVQFRIDWPAWLQTLSERDQSLIQDMSQGERTLDLAVKHKLSPARISQKRKEFHDQWHQFAEGSDQVGTLRT